MLFCHITSRVAGRKHDGLLTEKGGRGFPYLVYMDADGNVLNKPGRSVAAFRSGAEQANAYTSLRAKADRSPAEEIQLLKLDIEFGLVSADEAKSRADAMSDLDDAAKAELEAALAILAQKDFDKEVVRLMRAKGQPRTQEEGQKLIADLGADYFELYEAGKRTTNDPEAAQTFYGVLLQYGLNNRMAGPARAGYDGLKAAFGDMPQAKAKLEQIRQQVEALEGE